MGEVLFHAQDVATLWGIADRNNLYTTLSRYVQRGLLFRIHKGFYSLKDIKDVNKYLLGIKYLNGFAYISTETVLAEAGIIFQTSGVITIVSGTSKKFTVGDDAQWHYQSRKLHDRYLHNTVGLLLKDGFYKATPERAVADMLHFNAKYYFDAHNRIDWNKVRDIQGAVGYKITHT